MPDQSEVDALNARIVGMLADAPAIWEVPVDATRAARDEGRSVFGTRPVSDRAADETLGTPTGELPIRIFRPRGRPLGVYLHFHGGGWVLGATHHQDDRLERLADATRQVVVSVGYRLAPEDPYPAGPDDCEAAALALVETAATRFGVSGLTIGGESAGAHLALVTLLRMRDRHGYTGFRAANLLYGIFDLRLTPGARRYGPGPQVLTTDSMTWFIERFAGGHALDDPDISPLLADLSHLPPAIFTVGTNDPLLDDSRLIHERWTAAGCESELQVFEDAPHAFDAFDIAISRVAHGRIHRFLSGHVAS
jgi:acetyl esterase